MVAQTAVIALADIDSAVWLPILVQIALNKEHRTVLLGLARLMGAQLTRLWRCSLLVAKDARGKFWDYPNPWCKAWPRPGGMAEHWSRRAAHDCSVLREPWAHAAPGSFVHLTFHESYGTGIKLIWPDGSGATVYFCGSYVIKIDWPDPDHAVAKWFRNDSGLSLAASVPIEWTHAADVRLLRLGTYHCDVRVAIASEGNTTTYRRFFSVDSTSAPTRPRSTGREPLRGAAAPPSTTFTERRAERLWPGGHPR